MRMIEYFYNGMLLLSFVLIYLAYIQYSNTKELMHNGIKTKAKVIHLILINGSGDDVDTFKPVYEYIDQSGTKVTFNSKSSSSPASYKVGDVVKIVHSRNNNEHKILSFWGLYNWTIILLMIASPFFIVGGGYFLYSRT